MWRFLAGVGAALLLITAGVLIWRNRAPAQNVATGVPGSISTGLSGTTLQKLPDPGPVTDSSLSPDDFPTLPGATDKTKEQKRFERYDHNHNGKVDLEEFLTAQRKAFAKLDLNHDGVLSFEEYAAKRVAKFRKADANGDGVLTAPEFATTRIGHAASSKHKSPCPAPTRAAPAEAEDQ